MPEIGFAELPTWPQMRDDTVVKKEAEDDDQHRTQQVHADLGQKRQDDGQHDRTKDRHADGESSSVRSLAAMAWPTRLARISAKPARNAPTIVGRTGPTR